MLEELKRVVCDANLELVKKGIVIYTWGNVSGISKDRKYMVIKPSGVSYSGMTFEDMVVVDVKSGMTVEGKWKPSSDSMSHIEIYRNFPEIGGITHTHSVNAVAFAQSGSSIPAIGTTHADAFYGDIPCTRQLLKDEVETDYEKNTGKVIAETIINGKYNPLDIPGVLVKNHGPFTWGADANQAVYNAVVLEQIAEMTFKSLLINPDCSMPDYILKKHYFRKHGKDAYYGQN